jgi:hypothetical protein
MSMNQGGAVTQVVWISEPGKPTTKGNFTVVNPETGKEVTMEIRVTPAEYERWLNGVVIQRAMPNLSKDEREFLITGIFPGRWEAFLGPPPD